MNSFFLCIWPSSQDPCTSGVQKVVFAPVAFFYRKGIEFGKKYTILYRQEIFSAGMAFSGLIALYAIATKVMALFLLSIGAMIAFLLAFWAWKTCEKNWTDSLGEHNRVLYEVVVEFGDPAISVGMPSFQDGIAALRKTHEEKGKQITSLQELVTQQSQEIEKNQCLLEKLSELKETSALIDQEISKMERRSGAHKG